MPKRKAQSKQSDSRRKRGKGEEVDNEGQGQPAEITTTSTSNADSISPEWRLWGPYLSERQWGTVREDYSDDGNCWEYFPHDAAPYRAYQWGEDGLFGFCDDSAQLCMSLALWNEKDPILKERLFGLTGPQGNHGEDVKECYYYLESTPNHSFCKGLYKYPQEAFPYKEILETNTSRGLEDEEFELINSGVFDSGAYWDVYVEYAKSSPSDILCQYTIHNRNTSEATLHVLPQVWFRNTWSWGDKAKSKPHMKSSGLSSAACTSETLGEYVFHADQSSSVVDPVFLFTDNDTNPTNIETSESSNDSNKEQSTKDYYKDAFHDYIIKDIKDSVNPKLSGTKSGAYYKLTIPGNERVTVRCRLVKTTPNKEPETFGKAFDNALNQRKVEYTRFCDKVIPANLSEDEKLIARQAYAGLCFTKQFFYYHIGEWAKGRKDPLNGEWKHMLNHDIISMPDKWEFPWYATWDLAFHMVPYCNIDPDFAKQQLLLFLDDRYMHPNGQLPAYEFNFSDVNPPVHAWACLKVYDTAATIQNTKDAAFLKKVFHKLMLNFNWWVNKKDQRGCHIFQGGFLGMDNITCVNRSDLPPDTSIDQVDGTAWMAFYSICMTRMAVELSNADPVYEDMAVRFLKHYLLISNAINDAEIGLWDEKDGFYYDRLTEKETKTHMLRVRSLVGLSSMFATYIISEETLKTLPKLREVLQDTLSQTKAGRFLISLPNRSKLESMLSYMLNDEEFLSPYGLRSLSKRHLECPVSVEIDDVKHSVSYCPGESNSDMFGGNSNWRGPIWFCMNFLILEALDTYNEFYTDDLKVEFPTSSGRHVSLGTVALDLRKRLLSVFVADNAGKRPVHGDCKLYSDDPNWKDLVLFYEYFHGDTGRGCGASHQTGWTALVVCILNKLAEQRGAS